MQTNRELTYNFKENSSSATEQKNKNKSAIAADYIADMILEMRNLAKTNGQKTLQGLLEMAYYEAFSLANPVELTAEEREKLRELETYAREALKTGT